MNLYAPASQPAVALHIPTSRVSCIATTIHAIPNPSLATEGYATTIYKKKFLFLIYLLIEKIVHYFIIFMYRPQDLNLYG